jgi:hypothetical protein
MQAPVVLSSATVLAVTSVLVAAPLPWGPAADAPAELDRSTRPSAGTSSSAPAKADHAASATVPGDPATSDPAMTPPVMTQGARSPRPVPERLARTGARSGTVAGSRPTTDPSASPSPTAEASPESSPSPSPGDAEDGEDPQNGENGEDDGADDVDVLPDLPG